MKRIAAGLVLAVAAAGVQAAAQEGENPNTRDYGEAKPFAFDLDANGRPDRVQPRAFKARVSRVEGLFVAFDWHPDGGAKRATIFEYRYGDPEAYYWGYTLDDVGDLDGDGRRDLRFSTGDDVSGEAVILLNRAEGFVAVSAGALPNEFEVTATLEVVERRHGEVDPPRVVGRWDPSRRAFAGTGMKWAKAARTALRKGPNATSAALEWLDANEAVLIVAGTPPTKAGWVKVESLDGVQGWVRLAGLSEVSVGVRTFR